MGLQNPYEPPHSKRSAPEQPVRWLRRFAVLNGLLIFVPVLFIVIAYFVMTANDLYPSGVSMASAVELYLLIVGYFFIPNCIMLAVEQWTRRSSTQLRERD